MWEKKAILFLTEVVLSIRQMRPQKLARSEAGVRKRKMAAARQAARRTRLRQAEKDAGAQTEGKEEDDEDDEDDEDAYDDALKDAETSEDNLVKVTRPSLYLTDTAIDLTGP
jgi:hypothetical protein